MNSKINKLIAFIGVSTITCIQAEPVDYSKIKVDPKYVYQGDTVYYDKPARISNKDKDARNKIGSQHQGQTVDAQRNNKVIEQQSKNQPQQTLDARSNSNSRMQSLKKKEEERLRALEAERHAAIANYQKQIGFSSQQKPNNQSFNGYNQLQTNNEAWKTTQFDPNYFNNSTNPVQLQKSGKYQHLFRHASQKRFCWDAAANQYKLDPWLLFAVAKVESSFRIDATNSNKDKARSTDYGLMQINSFWLPHLAKAGITKESLFDPCTSIFVGAWIMRSNIDRFGYNIDGIGAYNSPHNLEKRRAYGKKVYDAYHEVTRDFGYRK